MPRKSPLSDYETLKEAISTASSQSEVLTRVGLRAAGGNFKQLKKWSLIHNLELPRISDSARTAKARHVNFRSDENVFCENSTYTNRNHLKKRLRKIWSRWECASCGLGEEWQGAKLTLQLEHKNGIYNDHRVENLELLCPNCHSQTSTFAGRSSKN